jgi:dTDP-4-dehydrorhamnose 3,5-epimerase
MHFHSPPHPHSKRNRCTRGAVLDIIVDLRPESATYLEYCAVERTEANHRSLYVPERFAHGYQTLHDDTEVTYMAGAFYAPESEAGLRHDDPRLGLAWPLPPSLVSDKDQAFPLLDAIEPELRERMEPTGSP